MKKIIVACASFKGTLSSREAGEALARGLRAAGCRADVVALADGGEGLVDALAGQFLEARICTVQCRDPLRRAIPAKFALLPPAPDRAHFIAVLEMAASSGLPLLAEHERNPLIATTLGVGDQILAALREAGSGAETLEILLGLGGSATNDGGAGMAQALGALLLDDAGRELDPGGGALMRLARIDVSGINPQAARVKVTVACDVTNPLCGPLGASRIYGPQKGATPAHVEALDAALKHYAKIIARDLKRSVAELPGSGAAGGLGAGCLAFLNASLKPGIELVLDAVNFDLALRDADMVITGEGFLDEQTLMGKACAGVAARAKKAGVPCVAIGGGIAEDRRGELLKVFKSIESLSRLAGSVEEAKRNGARWLEKWGRENFA